MAEQQNTMYGFDKKLQAIPERLSAGVDPSVATVDLSKIAAEDLARQRGQLVPKTDAEMESTFRAMMNSTTQAELDQFGVKKLGDFILTPDTLKLIKGNKAKQAELLGRFKLNQQVPQQDPFKLAVPMSGPNFEKVRLPQIVKNLPQDQQDIVMEVVRNRQNVAKMLDQKSSQVPYKGQEIILESFSTGDLVDETNKAFKAIPGDFARLPTFFAMVGNALWAGTAAQFAEDEPNGMDKGYKEKFAESFGSNMQGFGEFIQPYEDFLNKSEIFDSANKTFNRWYKNKFIEKHGADEWKKVHQDPVYKAMLPGDPEFDENRRDGKGYLVEVLNEDGSVQYKDRPLPPELVSDLIDAAYQELSSSDKAILFGGTQAPFTLGLTAMSVAKGTAIAKKVNKARKDDPTRYSQLDDFEVYLDIKKNSQTGAARLAQNKFVQLALGGATLGATYVSKGTIHRGTTMNKHFDTLSMYEKQIDDAEKIIKDKNSTPQAVENARADLKVFKQGFNTYKAKSGGSTGIFANFNNPYQRSLLADDVMISAAVGYAPAILSWEKIGMDNDVAEILAMITAPILAPGVTRATTMLGTKALDRATLGGVTDFATTLEHATFIPFITPGMLAKGEESSIRAAMEANGVAVTEKSIEAYQTMSKIYQSLKPEFQVRVHEGLQRYNNTMKSIETFMRGIKAPDGNLAFTEQEIADNMGTLHLSLAHATGLAPFIAVQARSGGKISKQDLRDAGKLDDVMAALAAEEANYKGMDTLLRTLSASILEKSGVDLDSNEPLQQMLVQLGQVSDEGMIKLNLKKQEMMTIIDDYANDLDFVDERTLERIVRFKTFLSEEKIREPIEQARLVEDTAVEILDSARRDSRALSKFSRELTESQVNQEANIIADRIFDISYGARRQKVSAAYRTANEYIPEGAEEAVTIDLAPVATKLMNLTDEYADKPFSYFFKGGSSFFASGVGRDARFAFESAARRGIIDTMPNSEDIDRLFDIYSAIPNLKVRLNKDKNGNVERNYTKLALMMAEHSGENVAELKYFKASVEETEAIYRSFRDAQAKVKEDSPLNLDPSFAEVVNQAYRDTDEGLLPLIEQARDTHKKLIGLQTDKNRYAGDVIRGRDRTKENIDFDVVDRKEGLHYYPIDRNKPLAPFTNIATLARKAVQETDLNKQGELFGQIEVEKNRLMMFYGAGMITDNRGTPGYGFDLTDRKQRVVADAVGTLLETLIGKEVAVAYETTLQATTEVAQQLAGQAPDEARRGALKRLKQSADYDTSRAQRVTKLEEILSIPVTNANGNPDRKKLVLAEIDHFSIKLDDLLRTDANTRQKYQDVVERIKGNEGTLRKAAEQDVDKLNKALKEMETYEGVMAKPSVYFDMVFENATPESIETHIGKFVSQGMDEDEVRAGLKYMYLRGIDAKAGKKTELVASDVTQVVQDASVLIDYVYGKKNAPVMRAVLGEEHYEFMKNIADWADVAIGNNLGFRSDPDLRGMSIESQFSRVFNLARGMVSPIYVGTEVTARALMIKQQTLIGLALGDKVAARIIGEMLNSPKPVSRADMKLLGKRIENYLVTDIIRSGGEMPTLNQLLGEEVSKPQAELVEEEVAIPQREAEEERLRKIAAGET